MTLKRSKHYVAILVGGIPVGVEKTIELVADHEHHLNFIHGLNVFILYFHSRKSLHELRKIFSINLRQYVDLIFVFRLKLSSAHFISPKIRAEMIAAQEERRNVIGEDLDVLKDVLGAHIRLQMMPSPLPDLTKENKAPAEESVSDREIMGKLLDKMKATGYASLSSAELDFLRTYTDKLNKNDKDDVD